MSRIGLTPITLPTTVTLTITPGNVTVKGPKGELSLVTPMGIKVVVDGQTVTIEQARTGRPAQALHGAIRAILANNIVGVSTGWTKTLELVGVGYRATMTGTNLTLSVGFSHQVTMVPAPGITYSVVDGKVVVSGIDKQLIGQMAADIRKIRPPEPYKGKGIKYQGEHIRKKAGKSAKAVGGGGK